jgi:hypothetical protein
MPEDTAQPAIELHPAVSKRRVYAKLDNVSGVRLDAVGRRIAMELGNGNISQGVRYALRFAAQQDAKPAKLSAILRSAARMAEALEQPRHSST